MKQTKIHWDAQKDAVESAREALPVLAVDLFKAGRQAVQGTVNIKDLHEFRLQTKRFRYTLELFQPLYGPAVQGRLAALRQLQGHLGLVHDCAAVRALVKKCAPRNKQASKRKTILRYLAELEVARCKEFLVFWREQFDVPGAEQRWAHYLRDYAGRHGSSAID